MAQAARLSLRMQKELKLLLTDPPPGALFPSLSPDCDLTSLSTIVAQIQGPEGTVYAKGIFTLKIQIPERYPFQPPSVIFTTPIYHPNIDNGGRICLDILNLPPKGAWQPSLNISTVLTSIGLLLGEPNPDDGLMCEASREYKYNRQAFDQKARAMTEKYAKPGVSEHCCKAQIIQTNVEVEQSERESSKLEVDCFVSRDIKPCKISRKLSLEPSSSTHKRASYGEANNVPSSQQLGLEDNVSDKCNKRCENPQGNGSMESSSLESSVIFHRTDDHDMENGEPKNSCLRSNLPSLSLASTMLWSKNHNESKTSQDSVQCNNVERKNVFSIRNNLSLSSKDMPEGRQREGKENVSPIENSPLRSQGFERKTQIGKKKLSLGPLTQLRGSNGDNSKLFLQSSEYPTDKSRKQQLNHNQIGHPSWGNGQCGEDQEVVESVIVLDSEGSEEENSGPVRSKLSLVRKRIGKRKAHA